jgi:hypothetical protein
MRERISMGTSFERAKNSVGLSNFVIFYEDYKNYYLRERNSKKDEKHQLAKRLLDSNPRASSLSAQITRINYTVEIFKNYWDKDVLKAAIESNHKSITVEIRSKAKLLLNV